MLVYFHGTHLLPATRITSVSDLLNIGGGFEAGSAVGAPPDELIQGSAKPFIFVTFQYRLGQFGFLGECRRSAKYRTVADQMTCRRKRGRAGWTGECGIMGSGGSCALYNFDS